MQTKLSILFLAISLSFNLFGQVGEARTKAVLLERFSRFITWPDTTKMDSTKQFRILVFGDKKINKTLKNIYSEVKIKNRKVLLSFDLEDMKIEEFDMIYIEQLNDVKFNILIEEVRDLPILIVSNKNGYAEKGAHINIKIVDDSIEFRMNKKRFDESELKCSHLLYNQAKKVFDK